MDADPAGIHRPYRLPSNFSLTPFYHPTPFSPQLCDCVDGCSKQAPGAKCSTSYKAVKELNGWCVPCALLFINRSAGGVVGWGGREWEGWFA
jgi:hypothetical protein